MAQDVLAQIEALKAKADAEKAEVDERISGLVAEVADLREQVRAGLDKTEILAALDTLGTHIESIHTPPAEEPAEPPAEPVEPSEEPAE